MQFPVYSKVFDLFCFYGVPYERASLIESSIDLNRVCLSRKGRKPCYIFQQSTTLRHFDTPSSYINAHGVGRQPRGDENAAAVSGGGGRIAATSDDETVVDGSGVPDLFGEVVNELMWPAS
jgi:hypothetical protein